jgi:rhizoxin biosynthesis acyltransferase
MLPRVFVFSGQGTQSYFMAKDLCDSHVVFRRHMLELDQLFKDTLGHSIIERLYDPNAGKFDPLDDILISHPAIYMVECALGRTLIELDITPDLVLGASLGELAAATIADIISLAEGVSIVTSQARAFHRAGSIGGMIAILHDIRIYKQIDVLARHSEIAAINYDSNFVVAGDNNGLHEIEVALHQRNIPFFRLPVKQPFHSSLIDKVISEIENRGSKRQYSVPKVPFVSSMYARKIDEFTADHSWTVIREPIQLFKTVKYLEGQGSFNYIDLGPGGSLTNAIKRIVGRDAASRVYQVLTPFARNGKELDSVIKTFGRRLEHLEKDVLAEPRSEPERKQVQQISGATVHNQPMVTRGERIPVNPVRAYMFPGQGSQHLGMGAELFDEFKELTELADDILGYSIRRLCTEDPDKQLAQTQYTQPALYIINAFSYFKKLQEDNSRPAFFLGHSLGEYNALLAAGAFDFEMGLRLVKKRGELMGQASSGAMAAIIGCDADLIVQIIRDNNLHTIDIANFNAPQQTVISGPTDDIFKARRFFTEYQARFIPLNVSAPFHSRYMEPAVREFEAYLLQFEYAPLTCPVISNVTARPYEKKCIVHNLKEQLRYSVQWAEAIRYLVSQGIQEFEELGPGRVLTKLVSSIQQSMSR